ncbi:undecaprenyl-diphosphate phosphatase [Campylobacter corcagiensis]|uniref:Undecaprenyl-diphosphatase n=1 Tax=Campylobacter corcagiensis TaxID=1448857 RepID=A0A7M1LG81_9BACT|nr:undecaprenyl-diphosphate phosphatase [Campylobacter corcagiensis]QKF64208.1 undecaprenyl pyrophosphate phosphatase [Campylobacter corcagiensis]QOQ87597.1 undecaprenyl-diphosphate phosphatase [Campylobacter corcagiensis]
MGIIEAIILGIVEGLTEFLPVSSTGHLILASDVLGLDLEGSDLLKCFIVAIQLGSILAIVFLFFDRLRQDLTLWIKLMVGFVPTAVIGLLLYKSIKSLFNPEVVAYMLIIWGIIFIVVELMRKKYPPYKKEVANIDDISFKQAFIVGLSQCLAMVPGTSRSGATIITGLLSGLSRKVAAEFSFLLAIPTMFSATFFDIYKNLDEFALNLEYVWLFLVGGVVAFVVAIVAVKFFLKFVSRFDYIPFGIYRIIVGFIFLIFIF